MVATRKDNGGKATNRLKPSDNRPKPVAVELKLLAGVPHIPKTVPTNAAHTLTITASIDGKDELRIYRDRAEWVHKQFSWPKNVSLNGIAWNPQQKKSLPNSGKTRFLPEEMSLLEVSWIPNRSRGQIRLVSKPDHMVIFFSDPLPGAGRYELTIRSGADFPPEPTDPTVIARVRKMFATKPHSPIPAGGGARTEKDFDEDSLRWRIRRLAGAYNKFGRHHPAWDTSARGFLDLVAEKEQELYALPRTASELKQLEKMGKKAIDRGCSDPLVCSMYGWVLRLSKKKEEARKYLLHAALAFESSDYPKRCSRHASIQLSRLYEADPKKSMLGLGLLRRALAETVEASSDPFQPGEHRIFLAEVMRETATGELKGSRTDLTQRIAENANADPWIRHMVIAIYLKDQGWQGRGGGWAHEVTPEGWKIFGDKLTKARSHLLAAWNLHPEYPEAAEQLIRITTGAGGIAGETPRFWFDQTVAAQMDYMSAYDALINALRPRWHGSDRAIYDFGLECLNTGRFDTGVPKYVEAATQLLKIDGPQLLPITDGKEAIALKTMFAGYIEHSRAEENAQKALASQTHIFAMAWIYKYVDEARAVYKQTGGKLDEQMLKSHGLSAEQMHDEMQTQRTSSKEAAIVVRKPVRTFRHHCDVTALAVSLDGRQVAAGGFYPPARLWKTAGGQPNILNAASKFSISSLAYSPDSKQLAAAHAGAYKVPQQRGKKWGAITVWSSGGKKATEITGGFRYNIRDVNWLPDGKHVVAAADMGFAMIWNVATKKMVAGTDGLLRSAYAVGVSQDGEHLAVGYSDGTIRLWSVPSSDELSKAKNMLKLKETGKFKKHYKAVCSLAFTPDGKRLISSSFDGNSNIWNLDTKMAVIRLEGPHAALSGDGKLIVTGGGHFLESNAVVWDAATGSPLMKLQGQGDEYVRQVRFSADGNYVLTGRQRGKLDVWDISQIR